LDNNVERPVGLGPAGRLRLDISYDGTAFSGWAINPGRRTVQGVLEEHLSTVLREPIRLTVAGRTDAGVHAEGQVAHCDVSAIPEIGKFLPRLARFLPTDVRISAITEVSRDFDARFSALRRHYAYRLTTAQSGAAPLVRNHVVPARSDLDIDAMRDASARLLGLKDFAAFCRYREGATTVRELQRFDWETDGDRLTAYVSADAFCWSMVRSLVGAILSVGEGRREPAWIDELLRQRSRSSRVTVAPAHGLSLVRVDYPAAEELAARNQITRDVRDSIDAEGCCGD